MYKKENIPAPRDFEGWVERSGAVDLKGKSAGKLRLGNLTVLGRKAVTEGRLRSKD